MIQKISEFIDDVSDYLAHHKGMLPLLGLALIIVNLVITFIASAFTPDTMPWVLAWLVFTNLFLHIGLILAVLGLMLMWVL